jgi:amino acid adenylation domain-containing protein
MSNIAKRIAALSPEQRKLLELRLKQKQINLETTSSISPRKAGDTLPLSLMQEKLWFGHQLQPNLPLYNESSLFKLTGSLDLVAIKKSINQIIDRHETLRTSFRVVDDITTQIIAPELILSIPIIDLKQDSESAQEAKTKEIITKYSRQAFDLEKLPLLRSIVISLSEQEHLMLVIMHHIISDGWSWDIFCQELATFYQGLNFSELPIQYGDFTLWHRQLIQDKITPQLNYWKQQLKNAPPILELPTDYCRPSQPSFQGGQKTFIIPQQLTKQLKELSKQENVTTFMVLLAAFKTLLYRYSQQTDIVVGTPVANRDRTEIENLIGCFINTIVLRTNLDCNASFLELLQRVKATTLAAYNHQDLPFEELVKELKIERSLASNPLFQVMFVYQEAPLLGLTLPDLEITTLPIDNGIAKFDLTLYIEDTKEELIGFLEYSSDLFREDTIERMLDNFYTLLAGIVANPNLNISQLPLLTVSERNKLLIEWNDTQKDYQSDLCLHQFFEIQVTKTPDAIAVVFEDQHLTYNELNNQANRLANYLQRLGVGKDVLVGICLDRSLEMVIGLLSILKAGGAYLPIDPEYPPERIAWMLQDASPFVILSQEYLRENLTNSLAKIICLDREWNNITQQSPENLNIQTTPESAAYTIYTSGSTGKPKGVVCTYGGLVNTYLAWQNANLLPNSQDNCYLQMASFSFDVFTGDLIKALCSGSKLVICPKELLLEPKKLYQVMVQEKITCADFVPAVLMNLVDYLERTEQSLDFMKLLIVGSDIWYFRDYQRVKKLCGLKTKLINAYGVSEATIDSTYFEAEQLELSSDYCLVPIGRPFNNTQIYLLDSNLQPVPIGVWGEIYIGGMSLAQGYLNNPELTKEKFIPNPFNEQRLYKTGDLARYLPDGNIEYVGRIDHQIKLRGFRIELGEIESVLTRHPGVREAVVVVKGEQNILAAYIVPQHSKISIKEVRCFLHQQLPEYMIPNAFMLMDALPLTPNGKVDRRAVFNFDPVPTAIETNYTAPSTPIQEILTVIWTQILNLTQVGINDNFFELGGHSLLATQVISQVRKTFQVEIPLGELFSAPTIEQFSQRIETTINKKSSLEFIPLKPVERNKDLPLSFAQQRLWLLQQLEVNSAAYNGSNALVMQGIVNLEAFTKSINEIVRRHEILRTSFALVENQPVQKISSELKIPLTIIDLQNLAETECQAEVKRLEAINAQQPFNLTEAPLLRLTLLQLEVEKHILLVTMHHIISDAWSAGIFMREISALYAAFSQGKLSPLPELPIQYVDFAVWQQQWLRGEILDNQLAYWKQQLQDAQTILKLPTDQPRQESTSIGKQYNFSLTRELSQQLEVFSQQQGVTLFMTLLTIFNTVLYSYTKQEDILVGSPIANRNRSELEDLIGFFVNTLVLRTDLSNNPTFSELLQRVREVALGAYTHQDLPFEKLVSELKPERYRDRSPLFQVWFVLQNAPTAELKLSGLNLTLVDVESEIVRHDLKLDITKTDLGITGFFEYKQGLFSESAIATMVARFQVLIALVIKQPKLKLDELIKAAIETEQKQQKIKSDRFKNQQIQQLSKFKRQAINKD